jgi:hypothetical protein
MRRAKNIRQATGMVIVTVTEDQQLGFVELNLHCRGIMQQGQALTGIKEYLFIVGFNPQGKAVFRQKTGGRGIINQYFHCYFRNSHGFRLHVMIQILVMLLIYF